MSKSTLRSSPPRTKSNTPERLRSPSPPPKINTVPYPASGAPSTSHLAPPSLSFTAATPEVSPISLAPQLSTATEPLVSVLRVPATPPVARPTSSHKGKRKADEAGVEGGGTPPKETKEPRATFAIEPRPHRASANSNSTRSAPSSYQRKRARLSTTPESRPASRTSGEVQNAATTGSWSSRHSGKPSSQHAHSYHRLPPPTHQPPQRASSRRSLSQASIPMSALISPHAPSITRSSTFHMRDPRKPAPIQTTPWSLSFPAGRAEKNESWRGWVERGGSPLHAWMFFVGFLVFPLWWVATFTGIPKTRRLDAGEQEKGVVLDDPQVETGKSPIDDSMNLIIHGPTPALTDAKSWRLRCRVMAVISFFTYVPFIVLVAIFA
ncbi:hypothetical protein D9615_002750 [Tricholomella constricta]|uniref:Uncharacterized protein n=1 Tax=Tricholomella constricta TaxID=117010 RepID=A0A8H5HGX3_9AGAR|nr:hypothetical protein D9615_002750 [Tricholomella constricta]